MKKIGKKQTHYALRKKEVFVVDAARSPVYAQGSPRLPRRLAVAVPEPSRQPNTPGFAWRLLARDNMSVYCNVVPIPRPYKKCSVPCARQVHTSIPVQEASAVEGLVLQHSMLCRMWRFLFLNFVCTFKQRTLGMHTGTSPAVHARLLGGDEGAG